MTALLIYPTHANCREAQVEFHSAGVDAAMYPARTTEDIVGMPQNCWNEDADRAERVGLPVVKAVCPGCPSRSKCLSGGYLAQLSAVKGASVALCTHKRAEFSGLAELSQGRQYVSIHENPIDLLRPAVQITEQDLLQVQYVVNRLVNEPRFLDWFGNALRIDDEGNRYHDDELALRKERQHQFCLYLLDLIDVLLADLQCAEVTTEWRPTTTRTPPPGIERALFMATQVARPTFQGQPWQFALAAAAGQLYSAAILVDRRFVKGGGQGHPFQIKSVSGFRHNQPGVGATTWFNDATLARDRLEMIIGEPIQDRTPDGRIGQRKQAVQILRDVTRNTSLRIFSNVLRGVLIDRPQFQRVGVICHRTHVAAARQLGAAFDRRIVKVAYFGGGEDRSSNDWYQLCDLIVVVGTPRVPPGAVAAYLVQVGEVGAACREPAWDTVCWDGLTEDGESLVVETRGYRDDAWRRAHRDLVRSQLVQAAGRGRGILEAGCDVLVLSTEECGLVISDAGSETLNGSTAKILRALQELSAQKSKKEYLGNCAHKAAAIAARCGMKLRQTQVILQSLERRRLVRKVGERSGWEFMAPPAPPHRSTNLSAGSCRPC